MLDDVTVLGRLDSELYGALGQAVELTARSVSADVAAAQVINGPGASHTRYVTSRLRAHDEEESLAAWPLDDDSVFHFVQARQLRDAVFRPRDAVDELEYARLRLFRRVDALMAVRDCVCATFELTRGAWCVLALLRCEPSEMFGDRALATVERLRPALARVVARGLEREMTPRGVDLRVEEGQLVQQPVSTADLLAKLSKTELHVLNYLRGEATEREIADHLGRSPHTVHVHVKNIYRKLRITSRRHLQTLFNG